jgi:ferrous iron transport protein B
MKSVIRVALAGNPNCGKTTIFNVLTGARQQVGNYPGVTVEKKSGVCTHHDSRLEIVDLPGTYGLTTWSLDEKVARDFIVNERPDVVVNIVDASNLERGLYLTTQLIELGVPLVLAFNMADVAESHGMKFDTASLGRHFGARIVQTVGHRRKGLEELLDAAVAAADEGNISRARIDYGEDAEKAVAAIVKSIENGEGEGRGVAFAATEIGRRWLAVKMLEEDGEIMAFFDGTQVADKARRAVSELTSHVGSSPGTLIADRRYGYISGACQQAVTNTVDSRHTWSDKIDTVLTHPVLGMAAFIGVMYLVFNLTFALGGPPMEWLERLFALVGKGVTAAWPATWPEFVRSLLVNGVIGGAGGVLVFLPNIMFLFLGIALLEYSGYMARAAFIMDRYMHRIGLHGKSFIPMLIGFGCSVPGILATRTLDSRRDRLITMMVVPLMSCGARLPIYALIIPAFFPGWLQTPMLLAVYLVGILLAVAAAKVLGTFVFREQSEGLVIELPPYRMPTLRAIVIHMWERSWMYVRKAGTLILGVSVVMWVLASYPHKTDLPADLTGAAREAAQLEYSAAGRIGRAITPVLQPMGFDWKIGTALIGAFAAKEVFVAQLGVVNAIGGESGGNSTLREKLASQYSPLTGLCVMLFTLIGFPCVATVAAVRMESGRWGWALAQLSGLTLLAWVVTVCVFQVGRLIGL